MKTFSLTSIAVLSLIAMSGAHAGDVPTLTVKYADLDLSRIDGAATLYSRISHAARTVCAPLDFAQTAAPMGMGDAYKNCFSNAVSGTDYAPATSGTSILKGNGSGGFSINTRPIAIRTVHAPLPRLRL